MDDLITIANEYGLDELYSRAGGGNASIKADGVLYIKPSGVPLATLQADDLVGLQIDELLNVLHSEEEFQVDPVRVAAARAMMTGGGRRPSVELLFHALLPQRLVLHTHPLVANALTCNQDAERLAEEVLGDQAAYVPYTDPGLPLAKAIEQACQRFAERTGLEAPGIILLGNHGVIVAGDTPDEIRDRSTILSGAIEEVIERSAAAVPPELDGEAFQRIVTEVSPILRGALRKVVTSDCSDLGRMGQLVAEGPLIPDQIVYAGSHPLVIEIGDRDLAQEATAQLAKYRASYGHDPIITIVPGVGTLAAGEDLPAARNALLIYLDAVRVARDANRLGQVRFMSPAEQSFIEEWEAESYRKSLNFSEARGKLENKVVVITGAAQGFGLGLATEIVAQGASVVLADLNLDLARSEAENLCDQYGSGRAVAMQVDVSDDASTRDLASQICEVFGGVDVFISNAGVLRAGSVMEQPVTDFDLVTAVNYRGYFLCVRAVAPIMARQHLGSPETWLDIIEVNSKSGLEGSKRNFAYSGSKFGGIGLTQSFALELVEQGIKVNAVCPGNYLDGPLWMDPIRGLFKQYLDAGKVPGAATVADVRKYYEAKVPMGRGCTPTDLAKAIFYLVDQEYETGQAVPVTGGQNMLS